MGIFRRAKGYEGDLGDYSAILNELRSSSASGK
jgi:hypothetical protein